jgi:putative ABC transport system permease protein
LGVGDTVRLFVDGRPSTWRVVGIVNEGDTAGGAYTTAEGLATATGQPQRVNRVRMITTGHDERTRQTVAAAVDRALSAEGNPGADGLLGQPHRGRFRRARRPRPAGAARCRPPAGGTERQRSRPRPRIRRDAGHRRPPKGRPAHRHRRGGPARPRQLLVAALPALVLTRLLGVGLGNLFGGVPLPYRVSGLAIGIWLLVVVLGAILATDTAATRASRLTVREALAYL